MPNVFTKDGRLLLTARDFLSDDVKMELADFTNDDRFKNLVNLYLELHQGDAGVNRYELLEYLFDADRHSSVSAVEEYLNELAGIYQQIGEQQDPHKYIPIIRQFVSVLDEDKQAAALMRYSFVCIMFDRELSKLIDENIVELLTPWQTNGADDELSVTDDTCLCLRWRDLPAADALRRRCLVNHGATAVTLRIEVEGIGRRQLVLPARGRLNAFFVGEYLTCIKGALMISSKYAVFSYSPRLRRYDRSAAGAADLNPVNVNLLTDIVPDTSGYMHLLYGNKLVLSTSISPDHSLRLTSGEQKCIGLFACCGVPVVLYENGATLSTVKKLELSDVCAIVEDPGSDLYIVTRDGRAVGLKGERELDDVLQMMLARFDPIGYGDDMIVEAISCGSANARLLRDGTLQADWRT